MEEQKSFFWQPSAAEILGKGRIKEADKNLVEQILDLAEDEALIIKRGLIPKEYDFDSRKFMKHGREVKLKRFYSLEEAVHKGMKPEQLRRIAFNRIRSSYYSCYSFKPFVGTDTKTRRVSLVECLEGAKIYSYANQPAEGKFVSRIEVKPYAEAKRVEREGAGIIVRVASRRKGLPRYEIKFSSVPIFDNENKWGIANSIVTDHKLRKKIFGIRYTYLEDKESSRVFDFVAHEIAGYFAIIDHYLKQVKVSLEMNPFAVPTQLTVDYYNKWLRRVLIQPEEGDKPRKPLIAEKEIGLWGLVLRKGYEETFKARQKIKDYRW